MKNIIDKVKDLAARFDSETAAKFTAISMIGLVVSFGLIVFIASAPWPILLMAGFVASMCLYGGLK